MTDDNHALERLFVFQTGQPLDMESPALGTHEDWAASARLYLAKAVSGASGANTARVSIAALTVLLSLLDQVNGGVRA